MSFDVPKMVSSCCLEAFPRTPVGPVAEKKTSNAVSVVPSQVQTRVRCWSESRDGERENVQSTTSTRGTEEESSLYFAYCTRKEMKRWGVSARRLG